MASNNSPYYKTRIINGEYLDILTIRPVPADPDDLLYSIEPQYNYRPDLLAHDLYGSSKLWWVFTQRNLDVLSDPVYDFRVGTSIYLPKNSRIKDVLGL
jgi:hypothetical protein|tara:strand:+ start:694 stop:990 length:297 start_codon:yes stop_codon:yes gene_type:complete